MVINPIIHLPIVRIPYLSGGIAIPNNLPGDQPMDQRPARPASFRQVDPPSLRSLDWSQGMPACASAMKAWFLGKFLDVNPTIRFCGKSDTPQISIWGSNLVQKVCLVCSCFYTSIFFSWGGSINTGTRVQWFSTQDFLEMSSCNAWSSKIIHPG